MKNILIAVFVFCSMAGAAQTPLFPTSADIYLGLKKLNVLGSVLYIAAHPDDENTRLLTYFAKDKLYRTGYLSLTRGDGGQNLIGEEQGVELGLIRTQELLAARRIDGAEQFFSTAFDFGFSKTPQETFTKWDKEKILSDVVWVIRRFQPDVIITRFPTTGEGGHGHHTASAILANEAFTAAADAKRFPEQLIYVKPWQAERILWNTFNFGSNNTTNADQYHFDVGGYNPILGKSYGEIAAESRSQHKSQGFGVPRSRGEAIEYFKTTGGDAPITDLHEGVSVSWGKAASEKDADKLQKAVAEIVATYDFSAPQKSLPALLALSQTLSSLPESNVWMIQKAAEVKNLIFAITGLWAEAFVTIPSVAQGDSLAVNVVVNNRLGQDIMLKSFAINASKKDEATKIFDTALAKNRNFIYTHKLKLADNTPITQPYWLQNKMSEGYFNVSNQQQIGQPDVQPAITASIVFIINKQTFALNNIPVRYKFNDQVRGELYEPFVILPCFTVDVSKSLAIVGQREQGREEFSYTAQRNLDNLKIYKDAAAIVDERDVAKGDRKTYSSPFAVGPNSKKLSYDRVSINYFEKPGNTTAKSIHTIKYDHIPYIAYFTDAVNNFVVLDVKTAGRKLGYIVGAGDKVPDALEGMGYEVTLLHEKDLERLNLKNFDAIISGVRSFNTNDWMAKYYDKLMKYVEGGGNYIVQYSQSGNLVKSKIGPYPFSIVNKRITDENAVVSFLLPQHPVLNVPNKITAEDFKGWVQERSTYHADNLDSHYESILRMNDPGEAPHDGSLVITKYGKGFFTYTGLVFFRELPAGVPGAYRLLANIIALNQIKPS